MKKTDNSLEEFYATKHAYERAKERMSWSKKVVDRMMPKVFNGGCDCASIENVLRNHHYLQGLEYQNCNNIKIYGENIYFFRNRMLITLYRLDNAVINDIRNGLKL